MNITLNGEKKTVTAMTITELLAEISAPPRGIAVEVNAAIIPKSLHAETALNDNDVVEIVSFIGGG
ncbi:MAG: sulfur carrier protein ThiS [Rickettsiales bacterium]|nr:sulfur carrier protein ThiS [Rickettsiales bacterium]